MKKKSLLIIVVIAIIIALYLSKIGTVKTDLHINIIPKPVMVEELGGSYTLPEHVQIFLHSENEKLKNIAQYLSDRIRPTIKGYDFNIVQGSGMGKGGIHLILEETPCPDIKEEGYYLNIDKSIIIKANTPQGIFYGVQSLLQLFPVEIMGDQLSKVDLVVPTVKITDFPRFKYRGMHLDVGRHFFPAVSIKRYIDLIAMHKMNTFHWHLTEDQGWRIEIKKYPKLTEIGSKRKETVLKKNLNPYEGDGIQTEGYYRKEEIKEIVHYAKERYITIIPEIELPGHSQAALASYPHLGCTGGPYEVSTIWGVEANVYCAGNEMVFQFLKDVLTEVIELFPSKYIHIGGDECPKERWKECPKCQVRIKAEGLKDEHELQSYFITRIEKFLNKKGRNIIGWDEILEGGLAPNATVMSWRGMKGGIAAAQQKHDVVMTPGTHCYFDHYQADPQYEPMAWGGFTTLKKVYSFEPVPEELNEEEAKFILGAQGNVWTEYMNNYRHVEYMAVPRISALAEVVWSTKKNRNWKDFQNRLKTQFQRFEAMNVNYSPFSYMVRFVPVFNETKKNLRVILETEDPDVKIHYTLDGSEPTPSNPVYSEPIIINKNITIKAEALVDGKLRGRINEQKFNLHKAIGAKVTYSTKYSPKYTAKGDLGLVDGINSPASMNKYLWQGFEGVDMEAIIELNNKTEVNKISVGCFHSPKSWIYRPNKIEFYISDDGKNFIKLADKKSSIDIKSNEIEKENFICRFETAKVKFIKIFAEGVKINPEWHTSPGEKNWIFMDEIIVE